MPSSGSQSGAFSNLSRSTALPADPAVYFSSASILASAGKMAAKPKVTRARYNPRIRRAGRPVSMPSRKQDGRITARVASQGQLWSCTR